jgi:hypothetical protein
MSAKRSPRNFEVTLVHSLRSRSPSRPSSPWRGSGSRSLRRPASTAPFWHSPANWADEPGKHDIGVRQIGLPVELADAVATPPAPTTWRDRQAFRDRRHLVSATAYLHDRRPSVDTRMVGTTGRLLTTSPRLPLTLSPRSTVPLPGTAHPPGAAAEHRQHQDRTASMITNPRPSTPSDTPDSLRETVPEPNTDRRPATRCSPSAGDSRSAAPTVAPTEPSGAHVDACLPPADVMSVAGDTLATP